MFDIGFWELTLVAVVALLVVGPERLPRLARTAGLWIGKGRRVLASVKGEIDREQKAEELKRIMARQVQTPEVYEFLEEAKKPVSSLPDTKAPSAAPGSAAATSKPVSADPSSPPASSPAGASSSTAAASEPQRRSPE
jgi:sec-independent protein translocase protein TatB